MTYFRLTPYLYLAVALFCIYDGFSRINEPEGNYWLSFIIAGVAIFMFLFRMAFARRMEKRNREQKK
ncbi:MAG TPA: hypothetical protein VGB50_03300 [Flavobacterium sp.]|jgi:hypothetical protein